MAFTSPLTARNMSTPPTAVPLMTSCTTEAQARVARLERELADARSQVARELEAVRRAEELRVQGGSAPPMAPTTWAICKIAYFASARDPEAISLAVKERVKVMQSSVCLTWAFVVADQHRRGWVPWGCLEADFTHPLPPTLLPAPPGSSQRRTRKDMVEARKSDGSRAHEDWWENNANGSNPNKSFLRSNSFISDCGYNSDGLSTGGFCNADYLRNNDFLPSLYETGFSLSSSDAASKMYDFEDSPRPTDPVAAISNRDLKLARSRRGTRFQLAQSGSCSSCLAGCRAGWRSVLKLVGMAKHGPNRRDARYRDAPTAL